MTPVALIVEDERALARLVRDYLAQAGFSVQLAHDGPTGLALARACEPDLVVLDVMLPHLDGLAVCRELRGFSDAYVLMLTARAEEIDRVVGLEVGADDYLVKPFSPRELVARARAMLRRPRRRPLAEAAAVLGGGGLQLDTARHEVRCDGRPIELTQLEYALLHALVAAPGRVFSRAQLIGQVWGHAFYGDDHVVDVHIANLRKKLGDDAAQPRFIATVRGVGYCFGRRR
jgi:two-component system alkaline phosphatase synthesis response regulator PhoP